MDGIGMERAGTVDTPRAADRHWIWSTRGFVAIAGGYCLLHLILRIVLTPTLGVDDIDQALFAQEFAWGYGVKQPPLFTWMLLGLYKTLGVSLAAHAALKYALLFATFVFLYLGARAVITDPRLAVMAGLSPLLMNYLAVGAHQGFTHSLILSVCLTAAFWLTVRWVRGATAWDYAAMGLVYGLGLISKYNFVVFLLSALAAGVMTSQVRRRLADPRLSITLLVAAAVVAPHAWWLVNNFNDPAQAWSSKALSIHGGDYVSDVWDGMVTLVGGALNFLVPLWIFLLIFFSRAWRWRVPGAGEAAAWRRFLGAQMLWGFALVAAAIAAFQIDHIESRWLHPLLLLFPIYFGLRIEAAGYRESAPRRMLYTMVVISVIVVVLRIGQIHVGPHFDDFGRFHQPFPELARALDDKGFDRGTIVADDDHIGGNFRLIFPKSRVVTPMFQFWTPQPVAARGDCLFVWYARDGQTPPPRLRDFARTRLGLAWLDAGDEAGEIGVVERPVRYSDTRTLALGYWLIPERPGCGR